MKIFKDNRLNQSLVNSINNKLKKDYQLPKDHLNKKSYGQSVKESNIKGTVQGGNENNIKEISDLVDQRKHLKISK